MPLYPTREKIINNPLIHKKEAVKTVKKWKEKVWKPIRKSDNRQKKFEALEILAKKLGKTYNNPIGSVTYNENAPTCSYNPITKTIAINGSLSIISTLHEFAHHLHGHSELKACRWSIYMFKSVFPEAFKKLKWKRHMLVRQ